jgi:stage II sporulation protein D
LPEYKILYRDKENVLMNRIIKGYVVFFSLLCVILFSLCTVRADGESEKYVRIGLMFRDSSINVNTAVESFELSSDNGLKIGYQKKNKFVELLEVSPAEKITVKADKNSSDRIIVLSSQGNALLEHDNRDGFLQFCPKASRKSKLIRVNGNTYRGDIEVRRLAESDMTVINVLPLEQYLYGVVPGEIQASSHIEALKAQAVAARTYTLHNLGKHSKLGFDLCNTTSCQVYKGYSAEHPSTNEAVNETEGEKILYNGELAQVFYFSSSGGMTEDVENVWSTPLPYLRSVVDKYESGDSWNYNWEATYSAAKIKEIMLSRGYDLGDIISVKITKTAPSGRALELVIEGTKDERIYVKSGTRSVLSLLHSQWYKIFTDADVSAIDKKSETVSVQLGGSKIVTSSGIKLLNASAPSLTIIGESRKKDVPLIPTVYTFKGKGWGHAVGMSQEGAKGMANAGFKYDEILTHYFQGTTIE